MGTNYYAHINECEHCGRHETRHICKSLVSFNGHVDWDDEDDDYAVMLPSWRDWKAYLRSYRVRIFDEYGSEYPVEAFIRKVEATNPDARARQYRWVLTHDAGRVDVVEPGGTWLDPDGFSFYGGDFS